MPKYTITETRAVDAIWTYQVEAETQTEALEMVITGEIEHTTYEIIDTGDESYYDIND